MVHSAAIRATDRTFRSAYQITASRIANKLASVVATGMRVLLGRIDSKSISLEQQRWDRSSIARTGGGDCRKGRSVTARLWCIARLEPQGYWSHAVFARARLKNNSRPQKVQKIIGSVSGFVLIGRN